MIPRVDHVAARRKAANAELARIAAEHERARIAELLCLLKEFQPSVERRG